MPYYVFVDSNGITQVLNLGNYWIIPKYNVITPSKNNAEYVKNKISSQ